MEESINQQHMEPSGQTAGGPGHYEAPRCEVVEAKVEAGFQTSLPAAHEGFGDGDNDLGW